jgi:hypothetical protein
MRALRVIAVIGVVVASIVGFLWFLPMLLNPQYFGLQHKNARWYADFTAACDSVIASHRLGTNDSFEGIAIRVTDPSLPKIITDLDPLKIQVGNQRFWMLLVSDSHAGFGLTWDPKWDDTNIWVLHTTAESQDTVIYSVKRSVQPKSAPEPTPPAP